MQHSLTKSTSFGKRHLVLILAIVFGVMCSALSQLPGWQAGAQTPINDQIAFDRNGDMYLINSDGTGRIQLTETFQEHGAAWSPDGTQIVFVSEREDPEYLPGALPQKSAVELGRGQYHPR